MYYLSATNISSLWKVSTATRTWLLKNTFAALMYMWWIILQALNKASIDRTAWNSITTVVSDTFCIFHFMCWCQSNESVRCMCPPVSTMKLVHLFRIYFTFHQTFRMLNVRPLHKTMRSAADSTLGFPLLEELCIATTSYSYMSDKDLWDILFGSPRLRVLDLRGCSRITPAGLTALPCLGRLSH